MKKILFILLFISIVFTGYSKNVLEYDGYDWRSLTEIEKSMWAHGYLTACAVGILAINEEILVVENIEETIAFLMFEGTVADVYYSINYYYQNTGYLEAPLWCVVLYMYDKHWWEIEKQELPQETISFFKYVYKQLI